MSAPFPSLAGFESLARLGGGGMGNVYLAREQGLYGFEKLCAVKLIQPNMEELHEFRAMFMDEAQLMAGFHHPAVPQIHRFGEADGTLYIVMEYVAGENFAAILGRGTPPIPPLIACTLIAKVCRGLHAAHELTDVSGAPMNVVHRDVTPSNLVLTYDGGVKILDFGIALMRERKAPATGAGVVKGKPSYAAPEQFHARRIDRRADVFSASIVLWELLTGKKLIDSEQVVRFGLDRALELAVCPPSEVAGRLPADLDAIVLKGVSKNPEDRFETARDMARDLEAVIDREGCETLEDFAERELKELRAVHEERIRRLRTGQGGFDAWQPPPITQVQADPGGEAVVTQPTHPDRTGPASSDRSRTFVLPAPAPKRWALRSIALALAVIALLAGAWLLGKQEDAPAMTQRPAPPAQVAPPAAKPIVEVEVEPPKLAPPVPPPSPPKKLGRTPKQKARKEPTPKPVEAAQENSPPKKPKKGLIREW